MTRNAEGLLICEVCGQPLRVVSIRGRKHGLCHGQFLTGLTRDDWERLEEWNRKNPPSNTHAPNQTTT